MNQIVFAVHLDVFAGLQSFNCSFIVVKKTAFAPAREFRDIESFKSIKYKLSSVRVHRQG